MARSRPDTPGSKFSPRATAFRVEIVARGGWCLAAVFLLAGCASTQYVNIRSIPKSPLVEQLKLDSNSGPKASERTMQTLRQYALAERWEKDADATLEALQQFVQDESSAELYFAFAELTFLQGKRVEKSDHRAALDYFENSVAHTYVYLFDDRFGLMRNPYDPHFRGACDLYNGALECSMRILAREKGLMPGHTHTVETASSVCEVSIQTREATWRPEDFERFEFVSDYEVEGLTNRFQTYGLGVPLIAVRKTSERPSPAEKFYPPGLSFPVTAFLRILPGTLVDPTTDDVRRRAVLELYDPLTATDVTVGRSRVPLESDLSTPLAYFLQQPGLGDLATLGLLRVDKTQDVRGLYMVSPYETGKVPVVMVHGLWSSPITWMEMFNDLRSEPEIRSKYQFWFYLYPTGQPFWISAAQLREDLVQMRATIDPSHTEKALDQMVLVGHSMGGLVSKLQILESGEDFWHTASDTPFKLVKATTEARKSLEDTYFFASNPSVRRIITIGTPHRGSQFANPATQWLGRKLITLPAMFEENRRQLLADNPKLWRQHSTEEITTSIDSLAPSSPFLPVMLSTPRPAGVKHHNIVGVRHSEDDPIPVEEGSDGVVAYKSAHLTDVDSEIVVNADHINIHRHPLAVLEVRRILLEHSKTLNMPGRSPFQYAQAPQPPPAVPVPPQAGPVPPQAVMGPQPAVFPPTGQNFAAPPTPPSAPTMVR